MTKIPTRREINPTYAADKDLDDRMRAEENALRAEYPLIDPDEDEKSATARRALELLGDKTAAKSDGEGATRRPAIESRLKDIAAARDILSPRLDVGARKADTLICEAVAQQHAKLVAAIGAANLSLHEANKAYTYFTETLNVDSVNWGRLHPSHCTAITGDYRDAYSPLALWMREAVAHGFMPASKLPAELKL